MACCSWLVLLLIFEVEDILLGVYKVSYGSEILFLVKMILTLANIEIGMSLKRKDEIELI